jgi:hypothetical protein
MAFVLADRVRESSTTIGTGAIALGGAANTSYQPFSGVMSIGDTCWYCMVLPGSAWETGNGTYSGASTLTRTSVIASSNAGALVNFGAGTKDVFICQPALPSKAFPTGTLMLFQQTAAPIYWTKQVTHNDKALRVVSGTASFGGTNAFSTVMAQTTVGNTTNTQSTSPSHTHTVSNGQGGAQFNFASGGSQGGQIQVVTTSSIGSDAPHNHTIALSVTYVDLIIASKD